MSETLRVVAVGYDDPLIDDRDGFAVHAVDEAGEATAVLETSAIDCVVVAADQWQGVRSTLSGRFPEMPVVVYADSDSVAVETVVDEVDAFVPREAGEALLASRVTDLATDGDAAAMLDDEGVRFQQLAKSVGVGVLSIDPDSVVQFANPAVEELLGWEPAELEGESLGVLIPDRLRTKHFEGMQTYLETGERHLDWSGVDLPAERADGDEELVTVSFGEFEHNGERYFTGVITPAGVDDDLLGEFEDVQDRLEGVEQRLEDEELRAVLDELDELIDQLDGA